jgi:hypothetical protein
MKGLPFGEDMKNAAIEAIMNGLGSEEWKAYMSLFADNAEQLTRLTTEQATDEDYLPQMRAYIVSNAVCGGFTGTRTHLNIDREKIDLGLSDVEDGTVNKPFLIPLVQ